MKYVRLWQVGRMGYANALKLQKCIFDLHKTEENADTLLIVEHPSVYTTGIRTKDYSDEEGERLKMLGRKYSYEFFFYFSMIIL